MSAKLEDVLCCPMVPNKAGAQTVGDYLLKVLSSVWEYEESFNSKWPLGENCWDELLYVSLAEEGLIDATVDDEGEYLKLDRIRGHKLVEQAILAMWSCGS